jgi:hypothetical protein
MNLKNILKRCLNICYIKNNNPYENFELSIELNLAWLDRLKKTDLKDDFFN